MTDLRQVAQQALEALENTSRVFEDPGDLLVADVDLVLAAITALRTALSQPNQATYSEDYKAGFAAALALFK